MTILTSDDFSAQMVAQLRVLDASISAEVGTPERKIIDSVAEALASTQVDQTGLGGATDLDSKYGNALDQFTSLFGFARQASTAASGYVTFSRNTPAPATINISVGASIQASAATSAGQYLQYTTVTGGTIAAGAEISSPILVTCTTTGSIGNADANTLTQVLTTPLIQGITAVTNPAPITGGVDQETDNAFKVRFQNTVFRNLAGTEDQYLALALSTSYTTKANVIGPVSTYQEYIQIPDVDDAGYLNGVQYANNAFLPNGTLIPYANTSGIQNQWTTSQSSIPYAQDVYSNPSAFVLTNNYTPTTSTDSDSDITLSSTAGQYFFRPGVDYTFNYPPANYGDAVRENQNPSTKAPNFTFLNVFNPSSGSADTGLQTAAPMQVLLSEFSYLSGASRNSIAHNVQNAIDIYVDGSNPTQGSTVTLSNYRTFSTASADSLYIENFRRDGQPAKRPIPGNFFMLLYQEPIVALPETITIGSNNYYLGVHYWLVHEISTLGGSIRARDGIEWSQFLNADPGGYSYPISTASYIVDLAGDTIYYNPLYPYNPGAGNPPPAPGTLTLNSYPTQTQIAVNDFEYDANIIILQAALENARQITTDVLVHQAFTRYFKFDVTVMYTPNSNFAVTNSSISASLQAYMNNQFFGSVIQLSDVLDVIHQTGGVDNVRWSNDLPSVPNKIRAIECDAYGNPLHVPTIDRIFSGSTSTSETQRLYINGGINTFEIDTLVSNGTLTSGNFVLSLTWNGSTYTTGNIAYNASAAAVATAVQSATTSAGQVLPVASVAGMGGPLNTASVTLTFSNQIVGPVTWAVNQSTLAGSAGANVAVIRSTPGVLAGGVGWGVSDYFTLQWTDTILNHTWTSNPIYFSGTTAALIQSAITSAVGFPNAAPYSNITVSLDTWLTNSTYPITSFLITYGGVGTPFLPAIGSLNVTSSPYDYDADFFLRDNELPSLPLNMLATDNANGLIVRPRAQNTFVRPGIG